MWVKNVVLSFTLFSTTMGCGSSPEEVVHADVFISADQCEEQGRYTAIECKAAFDHATNTQAPKLRGSVLAGVLVPREQPLGTHEVSRPGQVYMSCLPLYKRPGQVGFFSGRGQLVAKFPGHIRVGPESTEEMD